MTDDLIKARAYEIWEREGRIAGRELENWLAAQAELTAMACTDEARPPEAEAPKRTRRKRAPKAAATAGTKAACNAPAKAPRRRTRKTAPQQPTV